MKKRKDEKVKRGGGKRAKDVVTRIDSALNQMSEAVQELRTIVDDLREDAVELDGNVEEKNGRRSNPG